jgi:hypothetical protein
LETVPWDAEDDFLVNGEARAIDRLSARVRELEATALGWTPLAPGAPTRPGTYVVREHWVVDSIRVLQLPEGGPDKQWRWVTHWLGPLPSP